MMWRNVLSLGEPSVSRPELLKRFRSLAKRFPKHPYAARATATADMLEMMVKEDVAHSKMKRKPLEKMTVKERASAGPI